jgi:hypothetical protein
MTRQTTINGFACCGQDCAPDENGCTVDFEITMNQCYSKIPADQRELMLEQAPGFVDIVKARGKLLFTEVIANGIKPGKTSINRHDLTHVRHWAEVVSEDYVVECYREEMALKDPVEVQRRKAVAAVARDDAKRLAEQKKAEEKATNKAAALLAKDTERKRVEALSPDSKKREAAAKTQAKALEKQAAAAIKVAREEQEAKDVQAARDFLANLARMCKPPTNDSSLIISNQ